MFKKNKRKRSLFKSTKQKTKKSPKYKLGQLVRTFDIRRVYSKSDSTNWSYNLSTITEVIHDTVPSYRINYLPERYNQYLLRPPKSTLEENNQGMKELNLIQ